MAYDTVVINVETCPKKEVEKGWRIGEQVKVLLEANIKELSPKNKDGGMIIFFGINLDSLFCEFVAL